MSNQPYYRLLTPIGNLWYIGWIEFRNLGSKRIAMPKLDEYLQITDAAEYLGVCRNTLRNWGKNGQIQEHRHPINNYRLYKLSDLEALLGAVEQPPKKKRKPR